jgi:hypothetical protein
MMIVGDAGAAELGGFSFTSIGAEITNNTFRDLRRLGDEEGDDLQHQSAGALRGIYLDLNWGATVADNYFENVDHAMVVGGGKNHIIRRNKFTSAGLGHYQAPIIWAPRTSGHHLGTPKTQLQLDLETVDLTTSPWVSLVGNMNSYRVGQSNNDIIMYHETIEFDDNMTTNGSYLSMMNAGTSVQWEQVVSDETVGIDMDQLQYPIGATGAPTNGGGTVTAASVNNPPVQP